MSPGLGKKRSSSQCRHGDERMDVVREGGMMTRASRQKLLCALVIGAVALASGWLEPSNSSAQESVAVRAMLIEGEVPGEDPTAALWNTAPASEFPLSPQVHWPDRIQEVTVQSVKVRGLHNGEQIAIRLEYDDPTEDPGDAAAIEFMVGDKKAHFAHGQEMARVAGGPVNIWYWKNKAGKVLDMSAKGFGTLKAQDHQDVRGQGVYADGTWTVVFSRALSTDNVESDAQITPGEFVNIAFAMWDGERLPSGDLKEKGSQKAVSSWWYFRAEPPSDNSVYLYAGLAVGLAVAFQFALIRKLRKGGST
ncbi:MAG: ethylbenzene dehydrogenase-related protein [Nitrospiraceae bacterium]